MWTQSSSWGRSSSDLGALAQPGARGPRAGEHEYVLRADPARGQRLEPQGQRLGAAGPGVAEDQQRPIVVGGDGALAIGRDLSRREPPRPVSSMGPMAVTEAAGAPVDAWLEACRRMVAAQAELFARVRSISARTEYVGVGEGGDRTLVIDRDAEAIVFAELEALHAQGARFTAVSEERGEQLFGDGSEPARVVIDPIDGSLNARRTMPSFALSIAVASGPTMGDVDFAFVHDFGADEDFVAARDAGATARRRAAAGASAPDYGLEVVGLEATKPELIAPIVAGLEGKAYRCRAVGSLAVSICYVAAARFDGMLSARASRSVDVAAAQLIAREAGASVKFGSRLAHDVALDLDERFPIAAGLDEEMLGTLLEVQRAAAPGSA